MKCKIYVQKMFFGYRAYYDEGLYDPDVLEACATTKEKAIDKLKCRIRNYYYGDETDSVETMQVDI